MFHLPLQKCYTTVHSFIPYLIDLLSALLLVVLTPLSACAEPSIKLIQNGATRYGSSSAQQFIPNQYADAVGSMKAVEKASAINMGTIDRGVNAILTGEYAPRVFDSAQSAAPTIASRPAQALPEMKSLALQSAEQHEEFTMQRAANNILNSSLGAVNSTYNGMHQFMKDDIVGNLFNNIGQLLGKWLTEFTGGWVADAAQFLARALTIFVLNPNVAIDGLGDPSSEGFAQQIRAAADVMYGVAVDLMLLLFILAIWKYWADASWGGAGNLLAPVGRLIFTAGLLLAWATIYAFEIQISNEMIRTISFNNPQEIMMLDYSIAQMVKGGVMALGAGLVGVFGPILGNLGFGPGMGALVGTTFGYAGTLIFTILGGILIAQLIYILILKAIQTALLIAQYVFAPVFLVMFATPDTESYATGYVRAFVETSLWTFIWVGLLKILTILMFSNVNYGGKLLLTIGILQLMIQVPTFLGRAQISPVSDFVTPGLVFGTVKNALSGFGQMTGTLMTQGVDWYSSGAFSDAGLNKSKQVALNGLGVTNSAPQMTHSLNQASSAISTACTIKNEPPPFMDLNAKIKDKQNTSSVQENQTGKIFVPLESLAHNAQAQGLGKDKKQAPRAGSSSVQQASRKGRFHSHLSNRLDASTVSSQSAEASSKFPQPSLSPETSPEADSSSAQLSTTRQFSSKLSFPPYKFGGSEAASWNEANLSHVDTRKLIARLTSVNGVGLSTGTQETSLSGSTANGVSKINVASGANSHELTQTLYTAAFANNIASSDLAADAARLSVTRAKANQPQGLIENLCANWLGNSGRSWSTTSIAKQRFQQEMFKQAVVGSHAYLTGEKGNPYTDYLRERFGEWTPEKEQEAVELIANSELSESPWNRQIGPATEALVSSGIPIQRDTRAAMQNPAISAMHPVRRKQAVLAILTYTYPQALIQHSKLTGSEFQSAHGEMARSLSNTEVEQIMTVYELSGQSDLSCTHAPQVIDKTAQLALETNRDFATAYRCMKTASFHIAIEQGYSGSDRNLQGSYTDLYDSIPGGSFEKARGMDEVLDAARATLQQLEIEDRVPMTHINNSNFAKSYFVGLGR